MSCRCRFCVEGALGTRGGRGGDGSLSFPAATLCQPINVGAPFSSPPGAEAFLFPALLPLRGSHRGNRQEARYSPLGALRRARGFVSPQRLEQKRLSSVLGELPRLLFVLPFKRLLLARSAGTSWRGSSCPALDAGPGHQLPPSQELDAVKLPLCPPIQKINVLLLSL